MSQPGFFKSHRSSPAEDRKNDENLKKLRDMGTPSLQKLIQDTYNISPDTQNHKGLSIFKDLYQQSKEGIPYLLALMAIGLDPSYPEYVFDFTSDEIKLLYIKETEWKNQAEELTNLLDDINKMQEEEYNRTISYSNLEIELKLKTDFIKKTMSFISTGQLFGGKGYYSLSEIQNFIEQQKELYKYKIGFTASERDMHIHKLRTSGADVHSGLIQKLEIAQKSTNENMSIFSDANTDTKSILSKNFLKVEASVLEEHKFHFLRAQVYFEIQRIERDPTDKSLQKSTALREAMKVLDKKKRIMMN